MKAMYNRLSEVMGVLLENIENATCGLFFTRNLVGDPMSTIYDDGEVQVDICYGCEYFEVFGLTNNEQHSLEKYYELIRKEVREKRHDKNGDSVLLGNLICGAC